MNIGLDYDDTYTRDPDAWDAFIFFFRNRGHKVYVVTWRSSEEAIEVRDKLNNRTDGIFATNRKAKQSFMFAEGIRIDVWIDDNPFTILHNQQFWPQTLSEVNSSILRTLD